MLYGITPDTMSWVSLAVIAGAFILASLASCLSCFNGKDRS